MIGVSTNSIETHRRFIDENEIELHLIAEKSKTIKKSYGRDRITYLNDKKGTIRLIQTGLADNQKSFDQLKQLD